MTIETSQDKLKAQISPLIEYCEKRRALNQRLGLSIGIAGILLGLGATVSGIFSDNAKIAAIFGACSATTQAILFAYPVDKRERIHRCAVAKLQNLLSDLEIRSDIDPKEFEQLLDEFKEIRLKAILEDNSNAQAKEIEPPQVVQPES